MVRSSPPPWRRGELFEESKKQKSIVPIVSKANHPLLRLIKTVRDVAVSEAGSGSGGRWRQRNDIGERVGIARRRRLRHNVDWRE